MAADFEYGVSQYCMAETACGSTFPWTRDVYASFLAELIDSGSERVFVVLPGEPTINSGVATVAAYMEYVGRIDGVLMGAYITCDVQIVGTSDGAVLSRIAHQNAARVPDPCEMTNLLCSVTAAPNSSEAP